MSSDASSDDVVASYRRGLIIRAVVASVFLALFAGFTLLKPQVRISGLSGLTAVLVALVVVNPVLWWIGRRRGFPIGDFYLHWMMDVAAVTLIVHYLGGIDVPVTAAAYMVMIVSSATFSTWRASWGLAVVASTAYAAVLYAEGRGLVPHRHIGSGPHAFLDAEVISATGAIVFFFVFAYLAGTLATQLRGRSEEIARQKVEIETSLRNEQASREELITLSTIVQHDVFGPLSVTAGACREAIIGCQRGEFDEASRWLEEIQDRLRSIEGAVSSLGAFGAESENEEAKVDVYEVVEQALGDLEHEWKVKGTSIELQGAWPIVNVSRAALYHVMRNLLANAISSVPGDGEGRIVLAGGVGMGGRWEIAISDNGAGLPDAVKERLRHVPRGRISLKRRAGGNFGAGLSLAHVLASRWDGGIVPEDREEGAYLVVWIPAARVKDPVV